MGDDAPLAGCWRGIQRSRPGARRPAPGVRWRRLRVWGTSGRSVPMWNAMWAKVVRDGWVVLAAGRVSALGSGMTAPFLLVYLHRVCGIGLFWAASALSVIALAGLVG